ncbi:MAG: nucleic acid binding OB-fold tRNA/helicase-type [Ilumatobacteraceae bacterium]|nr:nucleic acid binding OB-fold tRNA/helicase-type [Ilumatobacteraceae bacterium]
MDVIDEHVLTDGSAPAPAASQPAARVATAAPAAPRRNADPAEPLGYRMKNKLLGPPLHTEQLEHETLGNPTALAVFASDCLSSSAYATEEILRVLFPYIGLAAFTLVTPVTIALLVVLGFLILSYRQTIKAYPSAGGAYIVTRDNFGLLPAQVAGVALLTDYVLTVAVSVAAGSDALASAITPLAPYKHWIAIAFVFIIMFGNLRGTKESGKIFAAPTYFFVANVLVLIGVGIYRTIFSSIAKGATNVNGMIPIGKHSGDGLLMGATVFVVLKAFGSGGAAVTGVEAISNGVPAFKTPAWKNARKTLVVMGLLSGVMFLGLSMLAARTHATPYDGGVPSVISQVGKLVYGPSTFGHVMFYLLQAGTMLILVLAANTSFADFPRLASFHAGDNFMPRQFTVRGHRLVFSNGIIFLAIAAAVTLLATGGEVSRLIPLYAIGVFTSFTLSQSGMAKHHIRLKEEGWKSGMVINGIGAILSLLVLAIVATVKFTQGAWVIVLLVPIMVIGLVRLNKAYEAEDVELHEDAKAAAEAPTLRNHTVIVLVDNLDAATARAMQYARTLSGDDLRAVHFDIDSWKTGMLVESWSTLGFSRFPLDIVECPDRRITRSAVELVSHLTVENDTELTILVPRREYTKLWHRVLHDRSSSAIVAALADVPHCNVTIVPYHLGSAAATLAEAATEVAPLEPVGPKALRPSPTKTAPITVSLPTDRVKIADVDLRQRAMVAGRVRAMRIQPWGGNPSLEVSLADETGSLTVVFFGRRAVGGVALGSVMTVTGMVGEHRGIVAILNPSYTLLFTPTAPENPGEHH